MEQPGAAAASGAGGGPEEAGGGRSNKRSTGNRAANEEETKNKPKLVSAPAAPAGLGDGGENPGAPPAVEHGGGPGGPPPPKCDRDLAVQLGEPLKEWPRRGAETAWGRKSTPPSPLNPRSGQPLRQCGKQKGPTPTWGDLE